MMRCFFCMLGCVLLLGACAKTTVVLLPDEGGTVGEVTVQAGGQQALLSHEDQQVRAASGGLSAVSVMPEAVIAKTFGTTLKALPEKPHSVLIYFDSESTRPTADSARQLPKVVALLKTRTAPTVELFGHTDQLGDSAFNQDLSDNRAREIRRLLIKHGVPAESLHTRGFGARDPLFPVVPGKAEPRNRRVEIFIR